MIFLAFSLLGVSFLSLWIHKAPKVWGTLLGASLLCALLGGLISGIALLFVLALLIGWTTYQRQPTLALFFLLIALSIALKLRLTPGFIPFAITPKFTMGFSTPMLGFFPLALLVPLARSKSDWAKALRGLLWGCGGIALLAILATLSGATHWQFKLPSFPALRLFSNLFLAVLPEEGFYRGFVQSTLCRYFSTFRYGSLLALFLTSILFTAAHLLWAPNLSILLFVFLASLLYGAVYLISGKIESAILCHFLLNFIHMTFFSYHAM